MSSPSFSPGEVTEERCFTRWDAPSRRASRATMLPLMSPMKVVKPPRLTVRDVRCACRDCGAHFIAWQGLRTLGGSCGNCGSYNGRPVVPSP